MNEQILHHVKEKLYFIATCLCLLILCNFSFLFNTIELVVQITIYPTCVPKRTLLIENFPHRILNESIHYQKKFNEYKQVHIHTGKIYEPIWFYETSLVREYTTLRHLENVFVSSSKVISTSRAFLRFWQTEEDPEKRLNTTNIVYENVVYPYCVWGEVFGHFLHDSLPILLQMPDYILNKSVILLQFPIMNSFIYTDLLGYPREKFIYYPDQYIYAKNLYMITPIEDRSGQQIYGFPLLRKKLREKLEVNSIKAEKYVLSNREGNRNLWNFKEVASAIKIAFPNIQWEVISIPYNDVKQCSKLVASFKVWFSPGGSNLNNMIYMQKNTGLCIAMADLVDLPNYAAAYMCDIWAIGFNNDFHHIDYRGGACSIEMATKAMDKLLYAMEHGQWPQMSQFFHPFNITRTKISMGNNIKAYFKSRIVGDHIE